MESINRWDSIRGIPHEVWVNKEGFISTETIIEKTGVIEKDVI